jgi:hypothetical protein
MLNFVVVGTGRCGTAYMAQLLTRMGIPCGHEWAYSAHPRKYADVEIAGDSSAQAVPFLSEFRGKVLHQVRDPLRVIGSFLGFGLFRDPKAHGVDGEFMLRHFEFTGNELDDAMRYYVEWNRRCEGVDPSRYLLYQLEQVNVDLMMQIARFLGEDVSGPTIEQAIAAVPRNFNTRFNSRSVLWSDLPEGPAKQSLRAMALRYGYQGTALDAQSSRLADSRRLREASPSKRRRLDSHHLTPLRALGLGRIFRNSSSRSG